MMNNSNIVDTARPLVSVLVPVFNEEENLPSLYQRVSTVVELLADRYDFEFIFMDNHSTDRSFPILEELAARTLEFGSSDSQRTLAFNVPS